MARRVASNIIDVIPSDDATTVFGPAATATGSYRPESGWRGSAAIGIIEAGARGARVAHGADGGPPAPGRRNRSALVAAGLGAVVAVVVAVALVSGGADDHPATAPATTAVTTAGPATTVSSSATATTDAASGAAGAPPAVGGLDASTGAVIAAAGAGKPEVGAVAALAPLYLPDLPQQYQVMTAEQIFPFGTVVTPAIARQLWTNGTPSSTSPRWMQIAAGDTTLGATDGGVRIATAHGPAVIAHNEFGGLTASASITGGNVTVSTAGLTVAEVTGAIGGAVLDAGQLTFADGSLPADLHMIANDAPADPATRPAATSLSTMAVSYQSSQDPTAKLFIFDMAGESTLDRMWDDYTVPVHDPIGLGGGRTVDVRSTTGTDGAWSWIDVTVEGASLRIMGTAPLADALIAARTLQRVGDERWTSLTAVAALNRQAYPAARYTDFRQLEGGADGNASRWSVLSARGADDAAGAYMVDMAHGSTSFSQADRPAVHIVSDQDTTVVIGVAPAGHDGAFLHVVLGTASYTVPLRSQGDGGTNLVGVFAFSNVVAPVAEVVDLGGEVLQTGPTLAG